MVVLSFYFCGGSFLRFMSWCFLFIFCAIGTLCMFSYLKLRVGN